MVLFEAEDVYKTSKQLAKDFMANALDSTVWADVGKYFARHEDIFWSNGNQVSMMRSFLKFGAPLANYTSASDRFEQQ